MEKGHQPHKDRHAELPLDPELVELKASEHWMGGRAGPELLLAIGLAGAVGALARYGVTAAFKGSPGGFPWGTFVVNLTGCLALGIVLVILLERFPGARLARALVVTGFLGAFTTFSTYAVGSDELVRHHQVGLFLAYVGGSLFAGLEAAAIGAMIGRLIIRRGRSSPRGLLVGPLDEEESGAA